MGRGIGKLQANVLAATAEYGKWIWARELVAAISPEPEREIPYSFYSSVLRAANSLVRRKKLCSGFPEECAGYGREDWRTAYWLPDQIPPRIRRTYPADLIENKVHEVVSRANEPLLFTDITITLARQIKADRYEYDRLKVPVARAIARLITAGKLQKLAKTKCYRVTTSSYTPTVKGTRF